MKLYVLFILALVVSCASKEERIKEYCSPNGAYSKGYADGKRDFVLSSKALDFCGENHNLYFNNYKQGYLEGQKNKPQEDTSALGASPNVSQPRKCLLRFRGDTFLGEGFSYGEAQQNAFKKCIRQYGNSCHMVCENL